MRWFQTIFRSPKSKVAVWVSVMFALLSLSTRIPPDELTLLFLYCPFMGDVFHRTLEAVFASHDRAPRRDGEVIRVSHP